MTNDLRSNETSWRRGEEGFVGGSKKKARRKKEEERNRRGQKRCCTYDYVRLNQIEQYIFVPMSY